MPDRPACAIGAMATFAVTTIAFFWDYSEGGPPRTIDLLLVRGLAMVLQSVSVVVESSGGIVFWPHFIANSR